MARPAKTKVDYFPHMTHSGKTIAILEARWGNDGYAFWFKLLEMLGDSNDFSFNCNHSSDWEYLLSKTRVTEPVARAILDKLAEIEAIDADCWRQKIVWSDNFVNNLEPVFEKRKKQAPQKPEFLEQKPFPGEISGNLCGGNSAEPGIIPTETDKVKESKSEHSKGEQREGKENEPEKREGPEKAYAGASAPAGESSPVSATEKPADSTEKPMDGAEPVEPEAQQQESASVLPEPPASKSKGKRHCVTPAQQTCPSALRPGVSQQADTVFLTGSELARLQREFGEEGAQRLIIILDGYKTNSPDKGAQYVDDYKAIRSWVVPRYRKELSELQPGRRASPSAANQQKTFIDKLADIAKGESE
jgi:hypothetical protein